MEPTSPSEDAEGQAIVRVLATVLERLVQANSTIEVEATAPPQEQTHFHAQRAPAIGILAYLERYVCFLYYIDLYMAVRLYCSYHTVYSPLSFSLASLYSYILMSYAHISNFNHTHHQSQHTQICILFQGMFHPSLNLH